MTTEERTETDITPVMDSGASVQSAVPGRPWLKPWVKGQSGNPAGRPQRSKSLKERYQALPEDTKDALVWHTVEGALSGHTAVAAKYMDLILVHSGEGSAWREMLLSGSMLGTFMAGIMDQLGDAAIDAPHADVTPADSPAS